MREVPPTNASDDRAAAKTVFLKTAVSKTKEFETAMSKLRGMDDYSVQASILCPSNFGLPVQETAVYC